MAAEEKAVSAADVEGLTFEEALDRLESIVDELESGTLTLEQSIARYEMGILLSKRLTQTLDQAEKQMERLMDDDEAEPGTKPEEMDLKTPEPGTEGQLPF